MQGINWSIHTCKFSDGIDNGIGICKVLSDNATIYRRAYWNY